MAKTLKVYKKSGEEVAQQEVSGTGATTVEITGLTAGTDYAEGDFQVSFTDGSKESKKVDVPAFTTNASEPTEGA
ncbi:tail morphogenetic protein [Staphylococcus phage vB_SsapH-Golestan-100]|nr:tail morphogenetic protein [Staphylococcus phage vB_SsapH-Golestan-100]